MASKELALGIDLGGTKIYVFFSFHGIYAHAHACVYLLFMYIVYVVAAYCFDNLSVMHFSNPVLGELNPTLGELNPILGVLYDLSPILGN